MTSLQDPEARLAFARFLGMTIREVPTSEEAAGVEGHAVVVPSFVDRTGCVSAGVLIALFDSVGGMCAGLASLPGWVVTTNLMFRSTLAPATDEVHLRAEVLRAGRNAIVTSVIATNADESAVADGVVTSAVLRPEGGPPTFARPVLLQGEQLAADAPSLAEAVGISAANPDAVEFVVRDAVRNPWGIVHGGAIGVAVDGAAVHAVSGETSRAATSSVVLHYLRPGRVGPIRAQADRMGERADGQLVRVSVYDRGADDRLLASAVATVRTR